MQYDEFIGQVQHRGRMSSRRDAERAVEATLHTLGERLAGGAAENLAAQLPAELGDYLRRARGPRRLSVGQFLSSVGDRASVDPPDAAWQARVVLDVLRDAVTPGTLDNIRAQFPGEFERLFDAGTEGDLDLR